MSSRNEKKPPPHDTEGARPECTGKVLSRNNPELSWAIRSPERERLTSEFNYILLQLKNKLIFYVFSG